MVGEYESTCPTCNGTGWEAVTDMGEAAEEPCVTCAGDGKVIPLGSHQQALEALREAIEAARLFNRSGMSWRKYDGLLARLHRDWLS